MSLIRSLQPTQQLILWGGAVEILCFGRDTGDWSLRDEIPELPGYPRPEVVEAIGKLAAAYNCRIYAPNTSAFNAQIVEARHLADSLVEDAFFRGVEADGVVLRKPGQAFAVSSADCPTFVLRDPITSTVVAAHAGRDSLIDPLEIRGPREDWIRLRPSSVQQAINEMPIPDLHGGLARLKAFIACGIGPTHFRHPYGGDDSDDYNTALIKWAWRWNYGNDYLWGNDPYEGCLNLVDIIRMQCRDKGVPTENIGSDGVDTYHDRYPNGRYTWHSHRREGDGTRNLVLVIRRS
ncbi:MAG: laccase domain-containing protein [Patescibacteria group bacterium]|nr:laccase domain-containing protein [Patescibacteria group bacterium]